ncbi:hypothetical protein EV702DRAFT_1049307 [Suillus placidus]|uniref:Uncharacterized protein n=1 Tax=Suillus placidus TaxID=48579 RepID=A0A9P6ZMS2_9AGAM|nr:hypothetical protein EV702DRAFT_1049307 [Suillus placidus]
MSSESLLLKLFVALKYYGYGISEEWRIWFSNQLDSHDCHDKGHDIHSITKRYYQFIVDSTPIKDMGWKRCFNPKGDSVPPEWITGSHGNLLHDKVVVNIPIDTVEVLLVCLDEEDSFGGRPHQDTIDYLTVLLGHGPKWWVGCSSSH